MAEKFKIKDNQLIESIFYISDIHGKGNIDLRSICSNILLHLNCDVIDKFKLLF